MMISLTETGIQLPLDLNELLIKHRAATFFVKIQGESMVGAGLHSGDILIVDRSLPPQSGKIAVAMIDGALTVRRLKISKKKIILIPENPKYSPIEVTPEVNFEIWGMVTYVIHRPG